jgi:hypothetical protein
MLKMIEEHAAGSFDPDDIRVLVAAFDNAWQQVLRSGVKFEAEREKTWVREKLAQQIILRARSGERDERLLCDDALLHLRDWRAPL